VARGEVDPFIKGVEREIGPDRVSTLPEDLLSFSYDAQHIRGKPSAVVRPRSVEEAEAALRLAVEHNQRIVPRGAGTGLSGGAVPLDNAVVLDLAGLDRIIDIDERDFVAVVEPGVVTEKLHEAVEEKGLFYPPDPASMSACTIGGNVAENAGGPRALKYGTTSEYLLGLDVFAPAFGRMRLGGRTIKNVTGYDLVRTICGSEGTLAVVLEATLKLLPLPPARRTLFCAFSDLKTAAEAVVEVLRRGLLPSAIEILDKATLRAVDAFKGTGYASLGEAVLIVEFDGEEAEVKEAARRAKESLAKRNPTELGFAETPEEAERLWEARRSALAALSRLKPTTILEDITVPRSKIPDMVRAIERISEETGILIGTFGHAGDGNLHPTILTDERNEAEMRKAHEAAERIFKTAIELGGTLSGEHGIGLSKAPFLRLEIQEPTMSAIKALKRAFDPQGILNPGKAYSCT